MEEADVASDHSRNRGKRTEDAWLFGSPKAQDSLQAALEDMYFLLSKEYPIKSSLALVGNRYRLKARQILALQGMSCSQQDIQIRKNKELSSDQLKGQTIYLDGFNVLILFESLLSGAYVFRGLDECYRDISSVHGTYKSVNQTEDVLTLVGQALQKLDTEKVIWIFDSPVSNSGRLKTLCYEIAAKHGFTWDIHLEFSPDKFLIENNRLAASSDAWVLNECSSWFNLGAHIIDDMYPGAKPDNIMIANKR